MLNKKGNNMVPVPKLKKGNSGTGTEINKLTKAFTLVELIVVITILAILATIGFVSFSGYLAGTRDVNRISQLKSMSDALELYRTKKSLPIPDDKIDIKIGTGSTEKTIAYQGYIGKNALETIEYTESGLDPKDKQYFSYYLTKNKKYFQLLAFLEEEDNDVVALNTGHTQGVHPTKNVGVLFMDTLYAGDYTDRHPYTKGKKLGILTDENNTPIQEIEAIKTAGKLNIDDVTTNEYKSYLKGNEVLIGSGTTFSKLKDIAKVGGRGYSVIGNSLSFIDLDKEGWRRYDPNCDIEDITIGTQTWAGCNSTLGNGIEFIKNNIESCYNYAGTPGQDCSNEDNLSNAKENAWNSTYGINNIWGKLYTWDNSVSACPTGYHVPTDDEWTTLENTLNGSSCRTGDGWECDGLGWSGHTIKTSSNNIVQALKLPLPGHYNFNTSLFRSRGWSTDLWSSSLSGSLVHGRSLSWKNSNILRKSWDKIHGFQVRCIKD